MLNLHSFFVCLFLYTLNHLSENSDFAITSQNRTMHIRMGIGEGRNKSKKLAETEQFFFLSWADKIECFCQFPKFQPLLTFFPQVEARKGTNDIIQIPLKI